MTDRMPALSLAAVPGRRASTVDLAVDIERRGFSGVYCPSFGDALGLCLSVAHATTTLEVATSIQPIYLQHPVALATTASYLHEIAEGRFRLGVGVTHGPVIKRLGVETGKPLSDMRDYVATMRTAAESMGGLPPVVLATLRDKMVELAAQIGEGAVWANGSRSRMAHSLSLVPAERLQSEFFVGNMIPTVVDDDLEAARARNRKTLQGYVALPNYRNYWIDAGYADEMDAVQVALAAGDADAVTAAMSDRWLDDCTLSGPASRVRDGVEAWFDAGVTCPIVVPSSTSGGQAKALAEVFEASAEPVHDTTAADLRPEVNNRNLTGQDVLRIVPGTIGNITPSLQDQETTMPYAHRPNIHDADSHLMEGLTWLRDRADATTRELLPDLTAALDKGGAGAGRAIQIGEARINDPAKTAQLEENVISSAKGWLALGAMDSAERTRALDLLGFESQLVFSTFSAGLFAFSDDPAVVYGGASAHNRMMTDFCGDDDRLVSVGFLPLNDPDRSLATLAEALELGCGAMWIAHATSSGRSPAHIDNDPVWAAIQESGVPIVLHIGAGRNSISKAWHNNGRPRPVDLHGGGENLRGKDLPSVHHAAETFLSTMVLDGVFERFPDLRCGVIEMGASWAPSLLGRLDYAAKSFARTEPMIGELSLKPSDYIRRQVRFTPFPGEDVAEMIAISGPELYLFSSDYPHPEGTKDPIGKFERSFDERGIDESARQRFYEDNYRMLVGV